MKLFDRFADKTANLVAQAPFFMFCILTIVVWLPSYFLFKSGDTWQLIINTFTTIVTFLLVALLQNKQKRFEDAVNTKQNAVLKALADLIPLLTLRGEGQAVVDELRSAVGVEKDISA